MYDYDRRGGRVRTASAEWPADVRTDDLARAIEAAAGDLHHVESYSEGFWKKQPPKMASQVKRSYAEIHALLKKAEEANEQAGVKLQELQEVFSKAGWRT